MTPIQTLKQMHSIGIYTNVPKPFVNKWYGRFRNGWTVGSLHGRPLFKDKKQPLAIKNVVKQSLEDSVQSSCKCRLQQVYCSASFNCRSGHVTHARLVSRQLTEEEKFAFVPSLILKRFMLYCKWRAWIW